MDYEKKYNEALERAKKMMDSKRKVVVEKQALETIFPELAESEDERIIEKIIDCLNRAVDVNYITLADRGKCLTYLEKQKEQKPVEIHVDNPNIEKFGPDVKITTSDSSADGKELLYVCNKSYDIGFRDGVACVKSAELSEEDEEMLNSCISSIEEAKENRYAYKETDGDTSYDHEINWLKSLHPQYHGDVTMTEAYKMGKEAGEASHWKPNEEQMKALSDACCIAFEEERDFHPSLSRLYHDLRKL